MRRALLLLLTVSATACASSGAVPQPFPLPSAASAPIPELSRPEAVVSTALSLRGAPYRDGGGDPSGFDCSGFVAYVFAQQGLFVPRTVAEQYALGARVDPDAVAPGDLVFFSTIAPGPSHVGIAISAEEFVHAPSSAGVVRVEALGTPYWASRVIGVRRVQ
jgi:peptidoglycan DL-endopeptidase CwlO